MKKRTLWNILLIALPVVCMMTAGSAGSVMVYSTAEDTTAYYSYFDLISETDVGLCLPLAALLCGISLMLASIQCFAKHRGWIKAIVPVSFGSMFFSVLPIVLRGEIMILPNMLVPIVMGVECLMAWSLARKPMKEESKRLKGPRLQAK